MSDARGAIPDGLRAVELFAELSDDELREVSWAVRPFSAAAGATLFRQGDPAEEVLCVVRGRVEVGVRVHGGPESPVGMIGAGEVLGEMAAIDGAPRSASAHVVAETSGFALDRRALDFLRAAGRPGACKITRRLARLAAARLRDAIAAVGGPSRRAPDVGAQDRVRALRRTTADLDRENLLRLPAFSGFSCSELDELLPSCHRLDLPRGATVFLEGDPPVSCFVTVRGAVEIRVDRDGERHKLALCGPGRMFGQMSLLTGAPRPMSAVARERTTLLEIDAARFDELFRSDSPAAFRLFDAVVVHLVELLRTANRRSAWRTAASATPARGETT